MTNLEVHFDHGLNIDLFLTNTVGGKRRVLPICFGFQPQPVQHLLLNLCIGDGCVDPFTVFRLDELDKSFSLRLELALSHEFAEVYSPAQCLQTCDVTSCSTTIIFLGLAPIFSAELSAGFWQYLADVLLFDEVVDIDFVVMEDSGVRYGFERWPLQDLRKERIFVWSIVSADSRMQAFGLG